MNLPEAEQEYLLRVDRINVHYPLMRGVIPRRVGAIHALRNVTFNLAPGEILGVVGESGSGKSTLGKAILGLTPLSSGQIEFENSVLGKERVRKRPAAWRNMQLVFQDPYSSLSPRMRVGEYITEPLEVAGLVSGKRRRETAEDLFHQVGLPPGQIDRYPNQFSGGQRQRIAIARALALEPSFIVADEAVSALDISVQAQIINLMKHLQETKGVSFLFIAHDLAVVSSISHKIAVMYGGSVVELADTRSIFDSPGHPYTKTLLAAIPNLDPGSRNLALLTDDVPDDATISRSGCPFRNRCPISTRRCAEVEPDLVTQRGRSIACHEA